MPYGLSADKQFRKQQKRAFKDQLRAQRMYERRYANQNRYRPMTSYYGHGSYDNSNPYYDNYDSGGGWKQQLLQVVIGRVVDKRRSSYGDDYPYYNDRQQYYPSFDRSVNYGYAQRPTYISNYDYQPDYYDEGPMFGDSSVGGDLFNSLPIAELIEQFAGGNDFVSQMFSGLLSQGFDEGYLAGQYARENGYGDVSYRDPYAAENGICDPYSASIGDNRQILSEGYGLGYEQALGGNSDYDPMEQSEPDLIGLLLNGVLRNV